MRLASLRYILSVLLALPYVTFGFPVHLQEHPVTPGLATRDLADRGQRASAGAGLALTPVQGWTLQFGSGDMDVASAVGVDQAGDVYVAGSTDGRLPDQLDPRGTDAFVFKYTNSGAALWGRQFGTRGNDYGLGMATDRAGNVYITGSTDGAFSGQTASGKLDAFVRKYDGSGNEQWTRQFGTSKDDFARAIAVDGEGMLYVAGFTSQLPSQDLPSGSNESFLRKYDRAGNELWAIRFGGDPGYAANAVAADMAENVYVAGMTGGTHLFFRILFVLAATDGAFIARFDATGREVWTRQSNDTSGYLGGMALDPEGNIYTAHTTGAIFPGGTSQRSQTFIRKHDSSGKELWERPSGGAASEYSSGLAVDHAGNILVAGLTPDYPAGQTGPVSWDVFVRKHVPSGEEQWTARFGSNRDDFALGVATDKAGGVYVVGYTLGTLPHQTSSDTIDQYHPLPRGDAFVRKYDSSGATGTGPPAPTPPAQYVPMSRPPAVPTATWTSQFGTQESDEGLGVAVDVKGNVYVLGYAGSTLDGQSAGEGGAFLRKYDGSGKLLWTDQFGAGADVAVSGIAIDGAGNAYVAGASRAETRLRKYDALGNVAWNWRTPEGTRGRAHAIAADGSGNVIIAGRQASVSGTADGSNSFVNKYDAYGGLVWGLEMVGTAVRVATDGQGNVYIAGNLARSTPGPARGGSPHPLLRKYDSSGVELWSSDFGNDPAISPVDMAVDPQGNAVVVGGGYIRAYASEGSLMWARPSSRAARAAIDGAGNSITAGGMILVKYGRTGSELWTHAFGGTGLQGYAGLRGHAQTSGIVLDWAGNVYITGSVNGAIAGQRNVGQSDAFIIKYRPETTASPAPVSGSGLGIQTGLRPTIDPYGYAALVIDATGVVDIATGATRSLAERDGVGSYDGKLEYVTEGTAIIRVEGTPTSAYPLINTDRPRGNVGFSAIQTDPRPAPPFSLISVYPRLTGSSRTTYWVTLDLTAYAGVALNVDLPQVGSTALALQRGDADNSGAVDATDALVIVKWLWGRAQAAIDSGGINALNAASPHPDDAKGDKITVTDAMYVAQMLAGHRDIFYGLTSALDRTEPK
ncbi:MAG: SBBP repeat-containing protein [Chloroflexi bacterium]|nr:SBBP repeat-containing protein [Chloroflexota bacterium]